MVDSTLIQLTDRVSAILERDEALIDVFVAASPAFERLRNPALRRVMAGLVTVEQAARVAGVDAAELVARLNAALDPAPDSAPDSAPDPAADSAGGTAGDAPAAAAVPAQAGPAAEQCGGCGGDHTGRDPGEPDAPMPDVLAALSAARILDVDVRDDLRQGREPFSRIMEARRSMPADGAFRLRAIFEPAPLYTVMARFGLAHWTERLAADDWRIWFYPASLTADGSAALPPDTGAASLPADDGAAAADGSAAPPVSPAAAAATAAREPIVLDVRGLEPPEPMVRTLEALEQLPPGGMLIQLNERVPQMLLPQLDARGFSYQVHEEGPDRVRVMIEARADRTT
jgi:uncharacterized protein (DUF2249 family)